MRRNPVGVTQFLLGPFQSLVPHGGCSVVALVVTWLLTGCVQSGCVAIAVHIINEESMPMEDLKQALVEELKDLYSAEKQIVKALPTIVRGAASEQLKSALSEHLEVTKEQVTRLEEVFGHLDERPKAKKCKGMEGLLSEGAECLDEQEKGELRDLLLIGAAQRVEHYEVAAYGTAKAMAEHLGMDEATELLDQTMKEEEEADQKLTEVAEDLFGEISTADEQDSADEDEEEYETAAPARGVKGKRR